MAAPRHARPSLPGAFVGLGDPVVDVLVRTSEAFLASMGIEAGGSDLVTNQQMHKIRCAAASHTDTEGGEVRRMGGSAANVARCLALLQTIDAAPAVKYVGMIGADATGDKYEAELRSHGVQPLLLRSNSGAATATCLCMVSPDGQRTMRTCLGAAAELASAAQLPAGWADGAAWLHCEGYCLHRPTAAIAVMREARRCGAQVSLDLASFEVVRHCWPSLQSVLEEGLLHTVFANEEEAAALLAMAQQEVEDMEAAFVADTHQTAAAATAGRPHTAAVTPVASTAEAQEGAAVSTPAWEHQNGPTAAPPPPAAAAETSQSLTAAMAVAAAPAAVDVSSSECNGSIPGSGLRNSRGNDNVPGDAPKNSHSTAGDRAAQPSAVQAPLLTDQQAAAAQLWLLQHGQVAVVSLGERGCVARSSDGAWAACNAERVAVQDSVGAGDNFTAGWLAAYLAGAPLQACAEAGCKAGAAAVQAVGGVPSDEAQAKLRASFRALLARQAL